MDSEEWREFRKILKEEHQEERKETMDLAEQELYQARRTLAIVNVKLVQHTLVHYSLVHRDWRLEVYPTTGRIYNQVKKPAPKLDVPYGWSLAQLAETVVKALSK